MNTNRPLDFLKVAVRALAVLILLSACATQPKVTPSQHATIITFVPDKSEAISSETLSLAQKILQERLNAVLAGASEVQVVDNTLRVKLADEKDLPIAVELATGTGELNFIDSDNPISIGGFIPTNPIVIVTDTDIDNATASNVSNMETWIVDVTLTPEGQRKLSEYTKSHIGNYVVITQDNKVLSSTIVNKTYERGQLEIVGEFDKVKAEVIAAQLNSGRLPIELVAGR
jgi:preprotein translocase subunit SecD